MKTTMLERARRLWNIPGVSRELNRANMRKWVRAVRQLGDNWVLHEARHERKS